MTDHISNAFFYKFCTCCNVLHKRIGFQAIQRDIQKNEYCKVHNITLYRMKVPFRWLNKWDYEDYYKYIRTELMNFVENVK